jgi:methionyl-tRNA formyltransferase
VTGRPRDARVRAIFLGSGRFAVPVLRRLAVHPGVELVGVVTAPARPTGRHQVPTPTPVGTAAQELGVPVLTPPRLRVPEALDAVLALRPGLAVLADYGQIVPPPLLSLPHGALNLHPSLLPRHRGASPIPAAILAGDDLTGVTLMRMDAGLDTGPIVAQSRFALDGTERADELEPALAEEAAILLGEHLGPWLAGELEARPQPEAGASLTRPLRREDGRLDPDRTAWELERQVRAYQPWPGTFVEVDGERLLVIAASAAPAEPGDAAGRLVAHGGRPALTTAGGRLVLEQVRPAGRREMPGSAWLRGYRGPALPRPVS